MKEETSGTTMPIVDRGQGFKPRRQQKRTFVESESKEQPKEEEAERSPAPLPFGKIDVFA